MAFDAAAFQAGSGGTDPTKLVAVSAAIVAISLLLWMSWVSVTAFRAWMKGDGDFHDFIWPTLRAAMVAMLLGYYIR